MSNHGNDEFGAVANVLVVLSQGSRDRSLVHAISDVDDYPYWLNLIRI